MKKITIEHLQLTREQMHSGVMRRLAHGGLLGASHTHVGKMALAVSGSIMTPTQIRDNFGYSKPGQVDKRNTP